MIRSKPKIIIMSGYGLNCEEETKFAFEWAGGAADIVHINDLIKKPKMLLEYQILVFPGGFSYGDDTGSGKAYANKFKNHLAKELAEFLSRNTLAIGICNGFQIMTNLGILPGALTYNKNGKYLDRWIDLEIPSSFRGGLPANRQAPKRGQAGQGRGLSPWLNGIKKISLPIAHGEGHYVISKKEYPEGKSTSYGAGKKMEKDGQIAFKYVKGEICKFQNLEKNPNGSDFCIAGVLAYNGRVLGMMPHPERAMFSHQSPLWPQRKASFLRGRQMNKREEGLPSEAPPANWRAGLAKEGEGLQIFKNAINYFSARGATPKDGQGSAFGGN